MVEMTEKKAIKKLTKKLERAPTTEEVAKFMKKQAKKAAASEEEEESPKKTKRAAEDEGEADVPAKKAKKDKKDKKEKKSKKSKKEAEPEAEADAEMATEEAEEEAPAKAAAGGEADMSLNPHKVCKVFVGNLSYDVNDSTDPATNPDIGSKSEIFGDCGEIVEIFFLSDKESGKFYGAGFVTFDTPEAAARAIAKNGTDVVGRAIKIDPANPRPGGDKPRTPGKKYEAKPMSDKEDGCVTMFMGNLSFDIDESTTDNPDVNAFFKGCSVKSVRWLTDRDTGAFKGCGFIEFNDTESVDTAAKLNGQEMKGRAIRLDYAKARAPKTW